MNEQLSCEVVRDLLPSYMDGLTEAGTNTKIEAHLKTCPACRSRMERMKEEVFLPEETSGREVDYLKGIRKHTRKRIFGFITATILLVAILICVKLFFVGFPVELPEISLNAEVGEDGLLEIEAFSMNSARTVKLRSTKENGHVDLLAREVLISPLNRGDKALLTIPVNEVKKVTFGEAVTLWQDGQMIDYHTNRLFQLKTPYVGNAPEVNAIISNMDLDSPHTLSLKTAQKPYGAILEFQEPIAGERRYLFRGNAYLLLALVDNLEWVSWKDPTGYEETLTLTEANASLKELTDQYNTLYQTNRTALKSVKDYAESSMNLQILREILSV